MTHRIFLRQPVPERCLPERVLQQLPDPGRLPEPPLLAQSSAVLARGAPVGHGWLSHFSPAPQQECWTGDSLSAYLTPQPGPGLEKPDPKGY